MRAAGSWGTSLVMDVHYNRPSSGIAPGPANSAIKSLHAQGVDPRVRLRAHVILLLSEGYAWSLICAVLFCSTATIARWKGRFEAEGIDGLLGETRGRRSGLPGWGWIVAGRVGAFVPGDFGYCRTRWCCAMLRDAGAGAVGPAPREGERG